MMNMIDSIVRKEAKCRQFLFLARRYNFNI